MKISILLLLAATVATGCSSPKPQVQTVPSRLQGQIDPSQPPYIYVDGEVRVRGQFAWTNGMTLQDAIDEAHGFTDFASRKFRVRHSDGSLDIYELDSKMHLTNNLPVLPGDRIFSPRHFPFL